MLFRIRHALVLPLKPQLIFKFSFAVPSPIEIKTGPENARLNPTICPTNPDLISFACNGDIWVTSMQTGQEVRLTRYHEGGPISEDPLRSVNQ